MQIIKSDGIGIDYKKSLEYNTIFISGGAFSGINFVGNFEPVITNIDCVSEGEHYIQVYVNPKTGQVFLEDKPVIESYIPQTLHIGGLSVICDGCGNYKIKEEILPENPCIIYARPFSSAFDISFNKKQAQYDICSIIVGEKEFSEDYNCDYAIQGTDAICPEDFALFNGNTSLINGNIELADGNTLNQNP